MAAGTMVSRLTGFVRSALIVSALGVGLLGDTFQVAYQLPTMIYILTVGGGLNSVFVPQLVRAMKDDEDGGEAFANRLLTLVMVALGALTVITVFAAPLLIRLLSNPVASDPAANEVGITFVRYFLPSIFFMGLHVVMGQVLNARGRFGAMMWTPVLNNIVIIVTLGLFIWVYGTAETSGMKVTSIPPEGERLLGIGVLLGLIVQSLAMIPYLRETGFRLRLRFDWRARARQGHHPRQVDGPVRPGQPGGRHDRHPALHRCGQGLARRRHRLRGLRQRTADLGPAAGHHHRLADGRPVAPISRSASEEDGERSGTTFPRACARQPWPSFPSPSASSRSASRCARSCSAPRAPAKPPTWATC